MNRRWVGVTFVAAGLAAGCGQGRVILNIDVYSFLAGKVNDSVPYAAPPGAVNFAVSNTPLKISLPPGAGSSGVDTVKIAGTARFSNTSGGVPTAGSISFQLYLAADSAGTYPQGPNRPDSMFVPAISASGLLNAITISVPLVAPNLSPRGDSLFTKSAIWLRIAARVSNPAPNVTVLVGRAVLTSLNLRVVVQDKIF